MYRSYPFNESSTVDEGEKMAAPILAAAIPTVASLFQGLMGQSAQREREKRERIAQATNKGFDQQISAQQQLGQGQASAFERLMQSYANSFGR